MLPSASNRYSALSKEVSGSDYLRIEMQDLQATDPKTKQAQRNEEVQASAKVKEIDEAPVTAVNFRASSMAGSESPGDEVTGLLN